jgi:hypothetical protein
MLLLWTLRKEGDASKPADCIDVARKLSETVELPCGECVKPQL